MAVECSRVDFNGSHQRNVSMAGMSAFNTMTMSVSFGGCECHPHRHRHVFASIFLINVTDSHSSQTFGLLFHSSKHEFAIVFLWITFNSTCFRFWISMFSTFGWIDLIAFSLFDTFVAFDASQFCPSASHSDSDCSSFNWISIRWLNHKEILFEKVMAVLSTTSSTTPVEWRALRKRISSLPFHRPSFHPRFVHNNSFSFSSHSKGA